MVPEIPQDIVRDNYSYGRNSDLEDFFQDIFFYTLASALKGQKVKSLIPASMREGKSEWIERAANLLEELPGKLPMELRSLHSPRLTTRPAKSSLLRT